jgi:hypothetical protein
MPGNSFQALLTEKYEVRYLSSIARHLHDKSLFIMNTRNTTYDEKILRPAISINIFVL